MSDPVAIATMLYSIAEEKKSSNLVIRDINGKFDNMIGKLERILINLEELNRKLNSPQTNAQQASATTQSCNLSDRDNEVLDFVSLKKRVCADDLQKRFKYRGRNAASARLSKLFKDNILEKTYVGKKVFYVTKAVPNDFK
jgi:hypothetical protein